MHARDKLLGPDVNLENVAKRCLGMSGADLANLLNEAETTIGVLISWK